MGKVSAIVDQVKKLEWAVCYGVAGWALIFGKIVSENNGNIIVKDYSRGTWATSSWKEKYVDKFYSSEEAQKAYEAIYRYATK